MNWSHPVTFSSKFDSLPQTWTPQTLIFFPNSKPKMVFPTLTCPEGCVFWLELFPNPTGLGFCGPRSACARKLQWPKHHHKDVPWSLQKCSQKPPGRDKSVGNCDYTTEAGRFCCPDFNKKHLVKSPWFPRHNPGGKEVKSGGRLKVCDFPKIKVYKELKNDHRTVVNLEPVAQKKINQSICCNVQNQKIKTHQKVLHPFHKRQEK